MKKSTLRQQAEEQLGKQKSAAIPETEADTLRLLHELQVHQIELEMQNEELVQARAETEAGLRQYSDLYDFAPVGYFTLARDSAISKVNLAGANLLGAGAERDKLIQRRFGIFVSAEFRPQFSAFLDKVFTSGKNEACEIELLNHGAHAPLWAHLEAITDSDEREACRLVAVDISERKRAESNVKFQASLLEAVGQAVIATDMAGTVIYFNSAAEELYGWSAAEAMGRNIMDINVPDLAQAEAVEIMNQLNAGKTWSGEFMVKRRDGTIFPAMVSDSPVINGAGQLIAIIGISTDVTERVQAEQKLAQYSEHLEEMVEERTRELREAQAQLVLKEKLATLGQLASGMGHELRNPLSVINSAIYYLNLVQPNADEKVREYHGIIKQEVQNTEKIINDLLDFERVVSANPEPVSIPKLVQITLERHPAPPSVKVTLEIPADLPKIYADSRQMEQTLGYLVVNAYQSMKDGGELVISGQCSVISEKPFVSIHVRDNGTGITPENMQRLFEPLFTTKSKGLGLGLALSKKFVEANQGQIEVESEAGKGSAFTVYLPAFVRKAG